MVSSVRIRGPFLGPSGYDHHVREFTRALAARGVAVELEQLGEWGPVQLPYELRDPWFESLQSAAPARTTVHFAMPTQVARDRGRANVNFTMFEATRIPAAWARAHRAADLIVLPTEDSRRAWVDSGVPESKLRLCPLGVRADLYRPGVPPLDLADASGRPLASYGVRLLNVSEVGRRKNLVGLLTAWLRATSPKDDAVLILKLGCYTPGSLAAFESEVAAAEAQAGERLGRAGAVHFLFDLFPDADMPRLFALGTHYVSMSFGEGWDLSMIQAAASGLRLIAPRHSGYIAYLDDDVASLIASRETPIDAPEGDWIHQLFAGASWWVPDEDEAVEHIRRAVAGQDAPRVPARDRIAREFTWSHAASRLLEILDECEAMSPRRAGD